MTEKILHRITPYIGIVLFLAAILIVHHELEAHTIAEISGDLAQLPLTVIAIGHRDRLAG